MQFDLEQLSSVTDDWADAKASSMTCHEVTSKTTWPSPSATMAWALMCRHALLSPAIVSDGYAVQNATETLGIEHASLATFGVARKFDWIYYCPACFRKYTVEDADRSCRICGTRLKRKVIRKRPAARKVGRR